jgi:hypothetical protein
MPPEGEKEEMLRDNELNYISAYGSVNGPFKFMSQEAKEKVH